MIFGFLFTSTVTESYEGVIIFTAAAESALDAELIAAGEYLAALVFLAAAMQAVNAASVPCL
jgi:hypothetical protein